MKFVEINAVVGMVLVPVEDQNYLMPNSAAFLAMLAAVELNMTKMK